MAEFTKELYRDEVVIQNYTGGLPSTKTTVLSIGTAHAGWSRPKPPILFPTSMIILTRNGNSGIYKRVSGIIAREGSLIHVGGDTRFERFENSSGDGATQMARARSKVSEFNFGETLVEFNDTANLIISRLRDVTSLFRNIKRGNWDALRKQGHQISKDVRSISDGSKRLSKGYLEFQFGWQPILSDIHSAIEAYGRTLSTKGDRVLKRSGNNRPTKYVDPTGLARGQFLDPSAPLEANATYGGEVRSPAVYEANRLGLANPALMVWNKLPFSFLVDWFLPISPIFGSLTAGMGLSNVFGCITTRNTSSTIGVSGPFAGVILSQEYNVKRTPSTSIIGDHIDNRGVTMRVGQVATAAALVRQVLMR